MSNFLIAFFAAFISSGLTIFVIRKFFSPQIQVNKEAEQQNIRLMQQQNELKESIDYLESLKQNANKEIEDYAKQVAQWRIQKDLVSKEYDEHYQFIVDNFNVAIDKEAETAQKTIESYQKQIEDVMRNSVNEYTNAFDAQQKKIDSLLEKYNKLQNNVNLAIEASKRSQEMKEKERFYKINLEEVDISEIASLRSITNLRNPEILSKVIWKTYYERPLNEMIARVVGQGTHIGIYRITNTIDDKCYIGQSLDIGNRFKQHVKKGLGADTATGNTKLYPIMFKCGPESFTFEVLEECAADELNERERYWIEYYHAKDFGYNIK